MARAVILSDTMSCIKTFWKELKVKTIEKCFNKCWTDDNSIDSGPILESNETEDTLTQPKMSHKKLLLLRWSISQGLYNCRRFHFSWWHISGGYILSELWRCFFQYLLMLQHTVVLFYTYTCTLKDSIP